MVRLLSCLAVAVLFCLLLCSQPGWAEKENTSKFIISPITGFFNNEVEFAATGGLNAQIIKDQGMLYGINMLYVNRKIVLGSLSHYSKSHKNTENGTLVYGNYYFRDSEKLQPALGLSMEYISIFTRLSPEYVAPLNSLNVDTSILALFPTVGVSYVLPNARITPFIGYFNEQVDTVVTSEGMTVAGANRFGFNSAAFVSSNYYSVGTKVELMIHHFVKIDSKYYYRFKENEKGLYTFRNRLDFYCSRDWGISLKYDIFQDKYESMTFAFIGPTFVF